MTYTAEDFIKRCAEVANAVGYQAGVGASETAGHIISVLVAHPEHIDRFMRDGSELFIDGTMRPENGSMTYLSRKGEVTSPVVLRQALGMEQ